MRKSPISLFLCVALILNGPIFAYSVDTKVADGAQNSIDPKYNKKKLPDDYGMDAEMAFYLGNYSKSEFILKKLKDKRDKNLALWSNQLGSLYLAQHKNKEAKDSFMDAYSLMNDIEAFQKLESKATGLTGSEAKKAYKGDPYEKLINSLYLGLLLYDENDLDNALACFKNGILCDSDVKGDLYGSDSAAVYLLAARLEATRGNQSMSEDYFNKAKEAYCLSHPSVRSMVSEEQALISLLNEQHEKIDKVKGKSEKKKTTKKNSKKEKELKALTSELERLDNNIKRLSKEREDSSARIDASKLKDFVKAENNVLLCIEIGSGPLKYQIGRYGEIAIFTSRPCKASRVSIEIDDKNTVAENTVLNSDIFYQASTRGGRVMDGILKGQAEFKQTTAELSYSFSNMSQQMSNQANQMTANNPYYDASGQYAAAAALAFAGLIMAIGSEMANPAADARHWSFMPSEIQIIPLKLSPGEHCITINAYDKASNELTNLSHEINVNVEPNRTNVVFTRIFENI